MTATPTSAGPSVLTYTYVSQWGSYGAQLIFPSDVAVDSAGNVYVADFASGRIVTFDGSGNYLGQWGTSGWAMVSSVDSFTSLSTVRAMSTLSIPLRSGSGIFTSSGAYLTQWGTYGSGPGQFNDPAGIAVDGAGNIYVSEQENFRVQKFSSSGTFITQWGSKGSGNGQFITPLGVAVSSDQNVYVADTLNNRIQEFDTSGN